MPGMLLFTLSAVGWAFASPAVVPVSDVPGPEPVVFWDRAPEPRPPGDVVVVIDPGHDPEDTGALSHAGIREVRYNDRLARRVGTLLAARPGVLAVLSRRSYEPLPLEERVARIAAVEPDLVVSLHHDSVKPQFITYRPSPAGGEPAELPTCERFRGFSLFAQAKGPHRARSQRLARRIADRYRRLGLARTTYHAMRIPGENRRWIDAERGIHAGDYLFLLRKLDAPVVLVESGFLVHPDEEQRLRDPDHVEALAHALADAIAESALETRAAPAGR